MNTSPVDTSLSQRSHTSRSNMAGLADDGQSPGMPDAYGTSATRMLVGLATIVAVTWLFAREVDVTAHSASRLVLAFGIFIVLRRILPH